MDLNVLETWLQQPLPSLGVRPDLATVRPRFRVNWVETTDSTNRALAEQMLQGAPSGSVLIAATQRSGRGQWGRTWQSPAGGLYLSLGLEPDLDLQRSLYLTLASAWGVATSLNNLGIPVAVKWPNDLVVQGRKLGGILVESRTGARSPTVIGLGLNSFNPVPATGISLQQLICPEQPPSPLNTLEGIAAVVLYGLMQGYRFWQTQGDEAFLAAYQAKMTHIGGAVMIQGQPATVQGIAPSGNLRVRFQTPPIGSLPDQDVRPGEVTLGYNA